MKLEIGGYQYFILPSNILTILHPSDRRNRYAVISRISSKLYIIRYPIRKVHGNKIYRSRFTTFKQALAALKCYAKDTCPLDYHGKIKIKAVDNPYLRG